MVVNKWLKYGLGRFGIVLILYIFSAVASRTVFVAILNFLCKIAEAVIKFILSLINGETVAFSLGRWELYENNFVLSIIGWAVIFIPLLFLAYDDGKKHTFYDEYNIVNVSISFILSFLVMFLPTYLIEYVSQKYIPIFEGFYFPFMWLTRLSSVIPTLQIGVAVGAIIQVIPIIIFYYLGNVRAIKKYEQENAGQNL